ncbi:unnamed protein product, partial [Rotaria sp. Silwood2]
MNNENCNELQSERDSVEEKFQFYRTKL